MTELRVVVPEEIVERPASEAAERGTSAEEIAAEVLVVDLLLNAGLLSNEKLFFDLAGEAGDYRSVGVGSAELRLWVPGSPGTSRRSDRGPEVVALSA